MKRHEMLEGLEITIKLCKEKNFSNLNFAEHLLKYIEALGMQPPAYYDRNYDDEPECDGMISEWEPEDEKT